MKRKCIVNPASGNGRTGEQWQSIQRALEQTLGGCDVVFTRAVDDAALLTHRALYDEGYDHIIAIGGDGTLSEVVNGFFVNDHPVNPNAVLSFVPSGTGSDVARTLNIPTDKHAAIAHIASRLAQGGVVNAEQRLGEQRLDVGKLSYQMRNGEPFTMYFLNVASFGLGGVVVRHINSHAGRKLKQFGGKIAFSLATLAALTRYHNQTVRLSIHEPSGAVQTLESPVCLVAVANGRFFGGGMMIAPDALIQDGVLDVVVVGDIATAKLMRSFPTIYRGKHLNIQGVQSFRATKIIAEPLTSAPERVLLDVDGEAPGHLPATFEVLPSLLRFV
jgi:YegS/Rv2252/BmrU family lipid kinase